MASLFRPAMGAFSTLALIAAPLAAQTPPASPAPASPAPARQLPPLEPVAQGPDTPWLFKGSDIPPDRSWTYGVLSNGLKYAVRKNGVPPGQVAIRVAIGTGSLMETDSERGFAHLIEHLTFRGSVHVPDGESKRVWQRLGVTFGSDSNASTSFTQTVYKLDLPSATPTGLDESMKILSGMMAEPTLTQGALNAERPVVLSEQREQPGPQVRFGDAVRALFFAGQPLSDRSPIGNVDTLQAATAASVKAFHDRWYRPDRAIIVIAGDADPAILEAMVKKHFSSWQGTGPSPAEPKFGAPKANEPVAAAVSEPTMPTLVQMAVLRPWTVGDDTILFNQERMIDQIALRILNRRLESRARAGGSYISAGANLDDVSRSANITQLSILPLGDDWAAALRDVRQSIADAMRTAPTQAEIDREVAEIRAGMENEVRTAPVTAGALLADNLISATDIRETVAGPETSLRIFEGAVTKKFFTPARVQAATKKVFEGTATRAIVNTRTPDPTAQAKLTAALSETIAGSATRRGGQGAIGFDRLAPLGKPGAITGRSMALNDPPVERVDFANGSSLLLFPNESETGKVYVRVRFGRGLNALPIDRRTPAFAADLALVASGIQTPKGVLGQEELDRLTGGRQIGLSFGMDDDAFSLSGITTAADLTDQLKLIAAKLQSPAWDPAPVARARAVMLASYDALGASPDGVMSRDLDALLHDNDPRWGTPDRKEIAALTPQAFKALWQPLLASGPVEVQVFGDVSQQAAIDAVAATIGTMTPRPPLASPAPPVRFPAHVATPVTRTHGGQPNQAAAAIAWPTGAGSAGLTESRKLEVLAAVFRDRLLDRLRSQAGVSYSPNVDNGWPVGLPGGGRIMAIGMVPPDKTGFFFDLARELAADLVRTPVPEDELDRAKLPVIQMIARMSSGNMFWMNQTQGGTRDPARLAAIPGIINDIRGTTPAELQALAAKYLVPAKDWSMQVLPEKK
ncbi:M16 family metallopeptidase [uncultured Sphingomonas sp.]|uniref:M16 family metallopeptidase n=1 Tax=uncultured Sphingomonas sp. TaxID=158754 RepID=UPI0025E4659B|nr:M16 family metallopeptidase [uncultured Sphingomonas sp.]